MDGIHDLGGRHGFGGSLAARDEAGFHAPWEERVFAIASLLMGGGCFNTDEFRHAIERLDPVAYLANGYYGRWLAALELLLHDFGGRPRAGRISDMSAARPLDHEPRFAVGAPVVTRNSHPPGHTRLPGYVRARRGTVEIVQGGCVLPDANAHGHGERP